MLGLRRASALAVRRLPTLPVATARSVAAPRMVAPLAQRNLAFPSEQREMSTSPAPVKLGSLGVDPLANSQAVQGVEFVLTGLDRLVNWARKSSMWPMTFGLA